MSGKARLTDLASVLRKQQQRDAKQNSEKRKGAKAPDVVNAPHGERGDYIKVSVTLTPALFGDVNAEAVRRKLAGEPNSQVSAIVREALATFLKAAATR